MKEFFAKKSSKDIDNYLQAIVTLFARYYFRTPLRKGVIDVSTDQCDL